MRCFCTFQLILFVIGFSCNCFGQPGPKATADTALPVWGQWEQWGDQGDGTYANPVLPGDYSDIDCIRVKDDYYAVSSTFQYSPGMVILHSKDLVNWRILGHVVKDVTKISPQMNWNKMNRYGRGIWAGAIRYHDHKFWVYFGDPDEGYFMTTARKPEGPWEPLHHLLDAKGWDDGCPFWDQDGKAYFIGTHFSDGYKIHLFRMTEDGRRLIMGSDKVIYQSRGSEANKFYKINGLYYHFFSEVKNGGRVVMMERAKNIWGTYEGPRQLSQVQKAFHEPNQGGIVQTKKGGWYFLTHHGVGDWAGRILSLLPVNWIGGWPVLGKPDVNNIGEMVWRGMKPVKTSRVVIPQTDDDFNEKILSPQWEWNYQPRSEKWSLNERKGWLRLHAFKPLESGNLLKAGNTLTERCYRTSKSEVIIKMDIGGMADGGQAGLAHYGYPDYGAIGVNCTGTDKRLVFTRKGGVEEGPIITGRLVWLKSDWGLAGRSQFSYSLDGKTYMAFGGVYPLKWGAYRGDRIAVFHYNNRTDTLAGYVDIDYFHYRYR